MFIETIYTPLCAAGSGVLAIAALKLGAAQAYGTDTDALAVRAAAQNVALNAMEERFQAVQCEASTEGPEPLAAACGPAPVAGTFDVVMANILQVTKARSCSVHVDMTSKFMAMAKWHDIFVRMGDVYHKAVTCCPQTLHMRDNLSTRQHHTDSSVYAAVGAIAGAPRKAVHVCSPGWKDSLERILRGAVAGNQSSV